MRIKRNIAMLVLLAMMLILAVGCTKKKEEEELDMGQAIAEFLEIDKVEIVTSAKVNRYEYVCFYYEGMTEAESGYSYAAFRKTATGEYKLEFAQLPSKLLPLADGIGSAYFDDHLIIVSSNAELAKIQLSGDVEEDVAVESAPFIYAVNIFQGSDTANPVTCTFYDKNGNQIQ